MKSISIPKKVKGSVIRLVAGQVFILALFFLFTGQPVFLGLLALDFLIRAMGYPVFSLLAIAGRFLADRIPMKKSLLFFKPKRFAASIGFGLSLAAIIAFSAGQPVFSRGIVGILGIFSFLEAFFGFCAGCKIYGFLINRGWIKGEDCPDCAS